MHCVELIVTPHAKAVLYTDADSLGSLLHPMECRRTTDCYANYSAPDTSFTIGFSLDTNSSQMSAAQWLQIEMAQRQVEVGGQLTITAVNALSDCDECAYAYYEKDTPLGRVTYFSGVVMRNGFILGLYSQMIQRDARLFADKCVVILKGLEVEAL